MSETGTDIWTNSGNQPSYAWQVSKYNGLAGTVGYINNTWKYWWVGINQANAGINRIDQAGFTDLAEKNKRLAELRFLRGFYYWHIVETWGNTMLRTTETAEFENTASRSTVKEIYDLIFEDLEFAKDNLPNDWGTAEYSRASKKSAIGMLARAYLSRGYYPDADANACFTKARDYAKEITGKLTTYNVSLYLTPADLWNPSNNKKNKESLYTISSSSATTNYNFDANGNKLHQYFIANYPSHPGMKASKDNGRYGALLMPTKYLLQLFEAGDKRYDANFQEKWLNNNGKFTWTVANTKTYWKLNNKDSAAMINQVIDTNTLALWISRTPIPNKATVNYCAFDLDDLYNTNGTVKDAIGNFPSFKKFMDPLRSVDVTSQVGTNDILVIRLAEMYAIAGEAEYKLNNAGEAATQFNFLRNRAGVPTVSAGDITPTWILEERAREFCGEHMRWFDLKRILRGDEWANYIKARNPDISLIKTTNWVRPISQNELNGLLNSAEFGQNPGYN
jgi:starch-binding outer membrane protein, SusD/RagB family